jgi:glycine reductase
MKNYLENKKIVILGDRDGIPGGAIKKCVETVDNTDVIFSATECFV